MKQENKRFATSITVQPHVQVVAFCLSLINTIYYGEREMALRAIAAYYGYKIEKL